MKLISRELEASNKAFVIVRISLHKLAPVDIGAQIRFIKKVTKLEGSKIGFARLCFEHEDGSRDFLHLPSAALSEGQLVRKLYGWNQSINQLTEIPGIDFKRTAPDRIITPPTTLI